MLPEFILIPPLGTWDFTIFSFLFIFSSPLSYLTFNPASFNIFSASSSVLYLTSGTVTTVFSVFVFSLSSLSSRYGKTSPKTCPATGAATAPAWMILTTQKFRW